MSLTEQIKERARQLGFSSVGCCAPKNGLGWERFQQWLEAGYAGEMHYLPNRGSAYQHPSSILEGVRTLILLTMNYATAEPPAVPSDHGRVSRYAWGNVDYHDLIHQRLTELATFIRQQVVDAKIRGVVDTAPLLEREYARWAGLGWIGKNTLLLERDAGSWFFLAALLTDVELEQDAPFTSDHCGSCRACLDACPTGAFPQPYVLDATRCISYLTIELREMIPSDLREGVGEWLFGCDICQDVCPWNRKAPLAQEPAFQPNDDLHLVDLPALLEMDEHQFRDRFRHTSLWRPKRRGLLRNAAIVLGNKPPTARSRSALMQGLNDVEPLVRSACAWALGRDSSDTAREALFNRLNIEDDSQARIEIESALQQISHVARTFLSGS